MEIDYITTGINLKNQIKIAGYDVKYIKEYLDLHSVQAIYKWQRGECLPTVEHMFKISQLLDITIDNLVMQQIPYTEYNAQILQQYAKYFYKIKESFTMFL